MSKRQAATRYSSIALTWRSFPHQLRYIANRAARCAGGHRGIGLQRGRNLARALLGRCPALGSLRRAARRQHVFRNSQIDRAVRNVDFDQIAVLNQPDRPAFGRFG